MTRYEIKPRNEIDRSTISTYSIISIWCSKKIFPIMNKNFSINQSVSSRFFSFDSFCRLDHCHEFCVCKSIYVHRLKRNRTTLGPSRGELFESFSSLLSIESNTLIHFTHFTTFIIDIERNSCDTIVILSKVKGFYWRKS